MKLRSALGVGLLVAVLALAAQTDSCIENQPASTSGVNKATATVPVGPDGYTTEQRNVMDRLAMDNKPGSIKHLYIISAYSGQVILYSTVKGKVTSSGKRLTPYSATSSNTSTGVFDVKLPNGTTFGTNEVLQDDGTYGESVPYIYWRDVQDRYHQQYITGGMILHISDQPIPVRSITINLEATNPIGANAFEVEPPAAAKSK